MKKAFMKFIKFSHGKLKTKLAFINSTNSLRCFGEKYNNQLKILSEDWVRGAKPRPPTLTNFCDFSLHFPIGTSFSLNVAGRPPRQANNSVLEVRGSWGGEGPPERQRVC